MEILFYRYGSICEPDLISVFETFGLTVITEKTEITRKDLLPSQRIKLLEQLFTTHTFTFVFSINFFPSISDICEIFRLPYVCWVVDSPLMELFSKSIQNTCNRIFLFDRAQYKLLQPYCPNTVFHLPLATNVSRWDQVNAAITQNDYTKYNADISFIGSLYSEKDPFLSINNLSQTEKGYIDGLLAAQEQVLGYSMLEAALPDSIIASLKKAMPNAFLAEEYSICNTDRYTAAHEILGMHSAYLERIHTLQALAQYFSVALYTLSDTTPLAHCPRIQLKGAANTLTEMPKIFHLSKINLNMTIPPIQTGLSLRVWDILGSGGFLLCNAQEELFEHFQIGEEVEVYSNLEELLEKCAYYLAHDEVRKKIAQRGYEKVQKYHTYPKRVAKMIELVYQTL